MYKIQGSKIIVSKEDFNIEHILYCGQIFSFEKKDDHFCAYSKDKKAKVFERENYYEIITNHTEYFVKFFDCDILITKRGTYENTYNNSCL